MMDYPLTLHTVLERIPKLVCGVEIVRVAGRRIHRYTYGDSIAARKRWRKPLQQAGLKPGDRVATLCWNHYAHMEATSVFPPPGVVHTLTLRLHAQELAFIVITRRRF